MLNKLEAKYHANYVDSCPESLFSVPPEAISFAWDAVKNSLAAVALIYIQNGHDILMASERSKAFKLSGLATLSLLSVTVGVISFGESALRFALLAVIATAFLKISLLFLPLLIIPPTAASEKLKIVGFIFTGIGVGGAGFWLGVELFRKPTIDAFAMVNYCSPDFVFRTAKTTFTQGAIAKKSHSPQKSRQIKKSESYSALSVSVKRRQIVRSLPR